jgi:hypothetical protein
MGKVGAILCIFLKKETPQYRQQKSHLGCFQNGFFRCIKIKKALRNSQGLGCALDLGLEPRTYGLTVRRSNRLS